MFKTDTPTRTSQFYTTLQPMKPRNSCVVKRRAPVEAPEDELELEESFSYGKTRDRRELREDAEVAASSEPSTLYECVSKGVLNMGKAAALICRLRGEKKFNNAAYEEFLYSDTAYRSKPSFEDLDADQENWWRYNPIALRLLGEINRATNLRLARTTSYTDKGQINFATATVSVDLNNCSDVWSIEESPPFKRTMVKAVAAKWHPRRKDINFQKLSSLFRFLLERITDPPEAIQSFSMRMNRRSGRNENLKNLPEHIEETLIGFGLDLLGFGRKEILDETTNVQDSAFYTNLGSSEPERREALEKLRCQRREWGAYVFTALQKSLRDVRSHTFDATRGWIPSTRQAKKSMAESDYVPCTQSPSPEL
ncbi:unnamed protein product [Cylicocyclus nassatus]|uniref:Uncharacterized protein n=1 Tax=Cylicocyclus nassatus TaxID=53992 RepID=A0AA36HB91_CYLNA|nr:unnamed protein product [Cylicocyclus nassatus]